MTVRRPVWFIFLLLISALVMTSPALPASLEDRLATARLELEIGIATEQRILRELESYRATPEASPERIALYETYLDRVRQLTEEKRKIVQQLEKARRRTVAGANPPGADVPTASLDVPEDKELDELRALERELDQSIAAFDDMLLTESELARVQSELKMKQLAQEAAQAARSLREGQEGEGEGEGSAEGQTGMESGKSGSASGEQSSENTSEGGMEGMEGDTGDTSQEADSTESGEGRYRSQQKSSSQGEGAAASGQASQDKAEAQDDDIVARQLREAAEKETDPVLKEKLWKEYYDYKKGL